MNYSEDDSMCRVDFFKPSGKWYNTCAFKWLCWECEKLIHDAFYESLKRAFGEGYEGMDAICLEPYHENAHPIQIKDWQNYPNRKTMNIEATDPQRQPTR